jgi:hypothetical protein
MTECDTRMPSGWRTPAAIALATALGVPGGIFLKMSAVPFGPVLLGWIVVLVGGFVASAALCILATHRYSAVGLGYAAGMSMTVVIASDGGEWTGKAFQFAMSFTIVGCASMFGSLLCGLLKWEDEKARERTRREQQYGYRSDRESGVSSIYDQK